MSRLSHFFGTVLLFCAAVFIALAIGEGLARVFGPEKKDANASVVRKQDLIFGTVLLPNTAFGHDSRGFKNKEALQYADIVALGDSHTYGVEADVSSSWPVYVGELAGRSVYNMGAGGYGPPQYWRLTEAALSLKPKLLVVGVYLGNDLFDSYNVVYNYQTDAWAEFRSSSFSNDIPVPASSLQDVSVPLQDIRAFIRSHSALYDLLAERVYPIRVRLGLANERQIGTTDWRNADSNASLRYEDGAVSTLLWPHSQLRGLDANDKHIREGARLTLLFLEKLEQQAAEADVSVALALFPTKAYAYAKRLGERVQENEAYVRLIESEEAARQMLFEHCTVQNVVCIDVGARYQELIAEDVSLYPATWHNHPTAEGYRRYAEVIYEAMRGHGLL